VWRLLQCVVLGEFSRSGQCPTLTSRATAAVQVGGYPFASPIPNSQGCVLTQTARKGGHTGWLAGPLRGDPRTPTHTRPHTRPHTHARTHAQPCSPISVLAPVRPSRWGLGQVRTPRRPARATRGGGKQALSTAISQAPGENPPPQSCRAAGFRSVQNGSPEQKPVTDTPGEPPKATGTEDSQRPPPFVARAEKVGLRADSPHKRLLKSHLK
jgi:hypothetical protein